MKINTNAGKLFMLAAALSVLVAGCRKLDLDSLKSATTDENTVATTPTIQWMPNELLVKFKTGTTEEARTQVLKRIQAVTSEYILTEAMKFAGESEGIYLLRTPMESQLAVDAISADPSVKYAELNYVYQHYAASNDPYFTGGNLWGMYGDASSPANSYGSQAAEAWANGSIGDDNVHVGIIDEGFMYNHEDLTDNAWSNPWESKDGVDNDGNGYIDDITGWDFAGGNNSTFDGTGDDHGTHVAGTIGGKGGNGKGVAGVCWNVTMISAKFLGAQGGTTANAVKAVDYLTDLKTRHSINLVASNNSWGGGGFSQSLKDAITRAGNQSILFICAAGNDGRNIESTPSYPAYYNNSNLVAVAAIASNGSIASWSNYGSTSVDLGAPGVDIYSCIPKASGKGKNATIVSGYASYSGTSMATPHVTGAAALYAATHSGASMSDIITALLGGVSTSSLSGKTVTGKRLDVSGF